jgi:hypothetical protein
MSSNVSSVNDCLVGESIRGCNRKTGAAMNKDQVYSVDKDCLKNKIKTSVSLKAKHINWLKSIRAQKT